MKINEKIIGSFLALNLILGGVGILSLSFMGRAKNDIRKAIKSEVLEARFQVDIKDDIQALKFNLLALIFEQNSKQQQDRYQKEVDSLLMSLNSQIDEALNNHQENSEKLKSEWRTNELEKEQIEDQSEEIQALQSLKQRLLQHDRLIVEYRQLLATNNISEAQQFWSNQLEPFLADEIRQLSGDESEASFGEVNEKVNQISQQLNRHQNIIYSTFFIGVLFSFLLARLIALGIVKPINQLKVAAIQLSTGDLDYSIDINSNDEIGQLAKSFKLIGIGLRENTISKSYFARILAAMTDSLIVTDLQGNIQTVNHVTCQLLQYSEAEFTKRKIQNFLIDYSWWNNHLSESDLPQNYQTKYITKDGQRIPITFSGSFIFDKPDTPCGLVFIARKLRTASQPSHSSIFK